MLPTSLFATAFLRPTSLVCCLINKLLKMMLRQPMVVAVNIRINSLTIFLLMFAFMVTNHRHWSSLTSTRVYLFVVSEMTIETSLLKSTVSTVLKATAVNDRLKRHLQIYWKRAICYKDYTCSHLQNSINCTLSSPISNRSRLMCISIRECRNKIVSLIVSIRINKMKYIFKIIQEVY